MTEGRKVIKVIKVRRKPSEYRVAAPWQARCNYASCFGLTSYHASQAEAVTAGLAHTRHHWKVASAT